MKYQHIGIGVAAAMALSPLAHAVDVTAGDWKLSFDGNVNDFAKRIDAAYETIRTALGVDFDERVTMYLYRDNDEGKKLVGRDLDFAEPDQRVVHQTVRSTPEVYVPGCLRTASMPALRRTL